MPMRPRIEGYETVVNAGATESPVTIDTPTELQSVEIPCVFAHDRMNYAFSPGNSPTFGLRFVFSRIKQCRREKLRRSENRELLFHVHE